MVLGRVVKIKHTGCGIGAAMKISHVGLGQKMGDLAGNQSESEFLSAELRHRVVEMEPGLPLLIQSLVI
jgi:hypothetical protein